MDTEKTVSIQDRPRSIIAPGQVVQDIMEKTCVSNQQAARRLGLTVEELERFFMGELPMSKDLAFKLKEATGFTASYWQGFERNYRRRIARWMEKQASPASF